MVYIIVIKTSKVDLKLKTEYKTLLHIKIYYYVLVMISLHNRFDLLRKRLKIIQLFR